MLKKLTILTISLITLFLVGCAGGGGSDGNSGSGSNSSESSDSGSDSSNDSFIYTYGVEYKKGDSYFKGKSISSDSNIKQIIVDGEIIDVSLPSGVSAVESYTDSDGNIYSGTNYKDTTFGLKRNGDYVYLYSQGNFFPNVSIPTSGTASYVGTAVLAPIQNGDAVGQVADISLNMDFSDKTVAGTVTSSDVNWAVSATIKDSSFSGISSDNTFILGVFYGSEASEVSGYISHGSLRENYTQGVYGAVKK